MLFRSGYSAKYDLKKTENSINAAELRARFAIDKCAITSYNNFSFGNDTYTFYNMLNAAYKFNDIFAVHLYADNTGIKDVKDTLIIAPRAVVTIMKKASISVGPEFKTTMTNDNKTNTVMTIPCIFRVKY